MKKTVKLISTILMIVFMTSCEGNVSSLSELNVSEPIGSPFNATLAMEYNRLAQTFSNDYLARKGLAANDGIMVMPEIIEDIRWSKHDRDILEKTEARTKLVSILSDSGREKFPKISAKAQAYYDCWVLGLNPNDTMVKLRHEIKNHDVNKNFSCRLKFAQSLSTLERYLNQPNKNLRAPITPRPYMFPSIASVANDILNGYDDGSGRGVFCGDDGNGNTRGKGKNGRNNCRPDGDGRDGRDSRYGRDNGSGDLSGRGKGALASVNEAMFLTFFDWNKSNITRDSSKVIRAVAKEMNQRKDVKRIILVGHADTSGSEAYNQNLSVERAISVSNALIELGISRNMIKASGRGERELMVRTGDNVREPANRRVEITLE